MSIDHDAIAQMVRTARPAQQGQLIVTREQGAFHEAPVIRINDTPHQTLWQINSSMDRFTDPLDAIWVPKFVERADGVIGFFVDVPPLVYATGDVTLAPHGEPVEIEVQMAKHTTLYRLYPTPGTVIHAIAPQAWMTINEGNLRDFEAWLNEHHDDDFLSPNPKTRDLAIWQAAMDFYSSTEKSADTEDEGEDEDESSSSPTSTD